MITDMTANTRPAERLLVSPRTVTAIVEFTSRCNLRCVYCEMVQKGYQGFDMDLSLLDGLTDELLQRRVSVWISNGHGETTMIPGWHSYCDAMLNRGIPLTMITNLARRYHSEEITTLSRFKELKVSCDTTDAALFGQLRRGAELERIVCNLARIKARALQDNHPPPELHLSAVLTDKTIFGLQDLVYFGLGLGVTYFDLCNVQEYALVEGMLPTQNIARMPLNDLPRVLETLEEARHIIESHDRRVGIHQGMVDVIKQRLKGVDVADIDQSDQRRRDGFRRTFTTRQPEGLTRDCLDPWNFVMVRATGEVKPCCWQRPIGTWEPGSLAKLLNNPAARRLRRQLLTGELDDLCRACPVRGWTKIANLQAKVAAFLKRQDPHLSLPRNPLCLQRDSLLPLYAVDSLACVPAGYDAGAAVMRGEHLLCTGWAVDPGARKPAGGVFLQTNTTCHAAWFGYDRKDVADFHQVRDYRFCGFSITLPGMNAERFQQLSPRLLVVSHDGKRLFTPIALSLPPA